MVPLPFVCYDKIVLRAHAFRIRSILCLDFASVVAAVGSFVGYLLAVVCLAIVVSVVAVVFVVAVV